jgi:DNA invertase Pin-like site-specific DNA recombinase
MSVMVTRIDRLARSIRRLQNIVHELRERGATLKATEQPIDTPNAAGKASSPSSRPTSAGNGRWGAQATPS